MQLRSFKAQGFKSFVEPVAFKLSGGLIGVVGPNGCGKSNLVDAIRWVLGESRSSSLRSSTLSDVLFNGSHRRQPVDWCDVELRFDNQAGKAGGVWSSYSDIIVRRELNRDCTQQYTINGKPVRRRDVVDLFRGTGVAPRAYGIIEQGMVSEIAEASPEALRNFIEEAAGVSHYKERRRDSGRRLAASQENLEQLAIILGDLQKRIESLKRQARTARRHRELGDVINRLEAALILSRRSEATTRLQTCRQSVAAVESSVAGLHEQLKEIRRLLAENRRHYHTRQSENDAAQQVFTEVQKAISAADRDLQNAAENERAARNRLQETEQERTDLTARIDEFSRQEDELRRQVEMLQQTAVADKELAEQHAGELVRLQAAHQRKQQELDQARESATAILRRLEAEEVRRQMLGEQRRLLHQRLAAAEAEVAALPPDGGDSSAVDTLSDEENEVGGLERRLQQRQDELNDLNRQQAEKEADIRGLESALAALSAELNTLAAIARDDGWEHAAAERLANVSQIDAGEWAHAVDAALGGYAGAYAVDNLEDFVRQHDIPPVGNALVELNPPPPPAWTPTTGLPTLLSRLPVAETENEVLIYFLTGVYAAETTAEAIAARSRLQAGEWIVTRAGVVFGPHSLRAHGEARGGYDWKQRQRNISAAERKKNEILQTARRQWEEIEAAVVATRRQLESEKTALQAAQDALAKRRIEWNREEERRQAATARRTELTRAIAAMTDEHKQATAAETKLTAEIEKLRQENAHSESAFKTLETALAESHAGLSGYQTVVRESEAKRRQLDTQITDIGHQRTQLSVRLKEVGERLHVSERRLNDSRQELRAADSQVLQASLAEHRQHLEKAQANWDICRHRLQETEKAQIDLEQRRETADGELAQVQEKLAEQRLAEREAALSINYLNDALEELGHSEQTLNEIESTAKEDSAEGFQGQINELRAKRERLGAVNFMAADELLETEGRLAELNTQKADIENALAELQNAIRKIDRETKTRLEEMFSGINKAYPVLFKRLFDGGDARLEMLGESILEAGFELKVRPPGKRLFPVRMLSGGEKAAAALAFIFSIFRLNPPPFCFMDEVDAPLDDNRCMRFITLLKEISADIQCLIVTHNTNTISALPRLIGVTQEEAGVSKIVSVTLDSALRTAEQ